MTKNLPSCSYKKLSFDIETNVLLPTPLIYPEVFAQKIFFFIINIPPTSPVCQRENVFTTRTIRNGDYC